MENNVTVCIATLGRETDLYNTIKYILAQLNENDEIIIIDQNKPSLFEKSSFPNHIMRNKYVKIIRQKEPNLPKARNNAAKNAKNNILIFIDDDIIPCAKFINNYRLEFNNGYKGILGGQVFHPDKDNQFNKGYPYISFPIHEHQTIVGCNFAVDKNNYFAINGFDENFSGKTLFDETDFMYRAKTQNISVKFVLDNSVIHLRTPSGGIRFNFPEYKKSLSVFLFLFKHWKYIPNKIRIDAVKTGIMNVYNKELKNNPLLIFRKTYSLIYSIFYAWKIKKKEKIWN